MGIPCAYESSLEIQCPIVKAYQDKTEPEKKSKLSCLVYPDKLKSEMRSEGENTINGKIAFKQGMAAYKGMGTDGCGYGRDRNVQGVK